MPMLVKFVKYAVIVALAETLPTVLAYLNGAEALSAVPWAKMLDASGLVLVKSLLGGFLGAAVNYRAARKAKQGAAAAAVLLAALLFSPAPSDARTVTVAWDANPPEEQVTGYIVYWGPQSRLTPGFTGYASSADVGNVTVHAIDAIPLDRKTYFAVIAYNASGLRSDYSQEISTAAAPSAVRGLTLREVPSSLAPGSSVAPAAEGEAWVVAPNGAGTSRPAYELLAFAAGTRREVGRAPVGGACGAAVGTVLNWRTALATNGALGAAYCMRP